MRPFGILESGHRRKSLGAGFIRFGVLAFPMKGVEEEKVF